MLDTNTLKMRIMDFVASSKNQRARPIEAKQTLAQQLDTSQFAVNAAVEELVEDEELVYSYRDPCSYIEIPCNGCDGAHRAARPMHVVADDRGNPWLCDASAELTDDLPGQCWPCEDMAFTRGG